MLWNASGKVTGVGEGVVDEHLGAFEAGVGVFKGTANKVRADEAGSSGNEDLHDALF